MPENLTARYTEQSAAAVPEFEPTLVSDAMSSVDPRVINRALSQTKDQRSRLLDQSTEPVDSPSVINPRLSHATALQQVNGTIAKLYSRLAAVSPHGGVVPYDPRGTVAAWFRPDGSSVVQSVEQLQAIIAEGKGEAFIRATRMIAGYAKEATYLLSEQSRGDVQTLQAPVSERAYGTLINIVARASQRLDNSQRTGEPVSQIQLNRQIWSDAKQAEGYDLYYDELIEYLQNSRALLVLDIIPRKRVEAESKAALQEELARLRSQPPSPDIIKRIAEVTRKLREGGK